jgi:hypothetical protein
MYPQLPPASPARPTASASQVCTEHLGLFLKGAGERLPSPLETRVHALIAGLRMVARN